MTIAINTFNRMSFLPFSDAAWTGLASPPTLQQAFVKAILAGDTVQGFVVADGDPFTFCIEGAIAEFPASVVDAEATVSGTVTITDSASNTSYLSRNFDGSKLYWYGPSGTITNYGAADIIDINTVTT